MSQNKLTTRIYWVDYARSIAIFLVVLTHALEAAYDPGSVSIMSHSAASQAFFFNIFNLTRHGVPFFLMITGFLVLSKPVSSLTGRCVDFWKDNLLPLFLTMEIWIMLYFLFRCLFYGENPGIGHLLKTMLLVSGTGFSHDWYIYMILGIYLFLPFAAFAVQNVDLKLLGIPLALSILVAFGVPTVNVLLSLGGYPKINALTDMSFSGGCYGAYMIFGYLIRRGTFRKVRKVRLLGISVLSFLAGTWLQWFSWRNSTPYLIWYDCATLLPASVCVFELFSRLRVRESAATKMAACLSACSFGVFLVHNPVLHILLRYMPLSFSLPVNSLIYCGACFLLSWIFVLLVSRIPQIGKHLFYIR